MHAEPLQEVTSARVVLTVPASKLHALLSGTACLGGLVFWSLETGPRSEVLQVSRGKPAVQAPEQWTPSDVLWVRERPPPPRLREKQDAVWHCPLSCRSLTLRPGVELV